MCVVRLQLVSWNQGLDDPKVFHFTLNTYPLNFVTLLQELELPEKHIDGWTVASEGLTGVKVEIFI